MSKNIQEAVLGALTDKVRNNLSQLQLDTIKILNKPGIVTADRLVILNILFKPDNTVYTISEDYINGKLDEKDIIRKGTIITLIEDADGYHPTFEALVEILVDIPKQLFGDGLFDTDDFYRSLDFLVSNSLIKIIKTPTLRWDGLATTVNLNEADYRYLPEFIKINLFRQAVEYYSSCKDETPRTLGEVASKPFEVEARALANKHMATLRNFNSKELDTLDSSVTHVLVPTWGSFTFCNLNKETNLCYLLFNHLMEHGKYSKDKSTPSRIIRYIGHQARSLNK